MKPELTLVPFGKYKGKPVEAMAQDRDYCEWLANQDWFRSRYATIHMLIVNNFAAPEETPEHNALQILFTDDDWVKGFILSYVGPTFWRPILEREIGNLGEAWQKGAPHMSEQIKREEDSRVAWDGSEDESFDSSKAEALKADLEQMRDRYTRRMAWLRSNPSPEVSLTSVTFERRGADVVVKAQVGVVRKNIPEGGCLIITYREGYREGVYWDFGGLSEEIVARVECKPVVGDDYPAVLRQMTADRTNVLLIGNGGYQGVGATFEQVEKMFKASGINIMLLENITTYEEARTLAR